MDTEYTVEACEYSFLFILCLVIFIYTGHQIKIHSSNTVPLKQRITKSIIGLTILGMLGFMINLLLQIFYVFFHDSNKMFAEICNASSIVFLFFGESMGHLLFIDRLNSVFYNTQYSISNHSRKLFYVLTAIFFSNWIVYFIVHILVHSDNQVISWNVAEILYTILFWFGAIMDFVIVSMLSYLFLHRLFLVSVSVNDEWLGNETEMKISPILHVVSKYFILTTISIIAVQVFLISGAMLDVHVLAFNDDTYPKLLMHIYWYMYPVQSLVAVYCFALNFHFSERLYLFFCGSLHKCCMKRFMAKAKSKIIGKTDYVLLSGGDDLL
eukprot:410725_1